jgi:hypothetical protein
LSLAIKLIVAVQGVLPPDYYALVEQHAAGFGPDILTLQGHHNGEDAPASETKSERIGGVVLAEPRIQPTAEAELGFYRRKQSSISIRHVSDDDIIAMIEIVSPGNKSGRHAMPAFVEKAAALLDRQIHLLIVDLFPPGKRDPHGIHGQIWQEISNEEYTCPANKPLTLVSYESRTLVRAYVVRLDVGDVLADMPLFLESDKANVEVPLEATYQTAFADVPRRWQARLGPAS